MLEMNGGQNSLWTIQKMNITAVTADGPDRYRTLKLIDTNPA